MGTRLRNRNGPAASAWLALAGLVIGVAVLVLPAAGAATASAAGRAQAQAGSRALTLAQAPAALQAAARGTLSETAASAGVAARSGTDPVYRELGASVAMSGATAVVGAPGVIVNGHLGAIYIFARCGKIWRLQATLHGSTKHAIGGVVAVSSTASGTFVLTAAGGKALVYQRLGTVWHLQATLRPLPAKPPFIPFFGAAVAISSTTAVVSTTQSELNSMGGIYVFARSGTTWHRQAILYDPEGPVGEANFGGSLAVSGSTILAGASNDDCAFVFTRSGQKWALQAALNPFGQVAACTEPVNGGGFGSSVAISGSTAVIGAPGTVHGAAYVFARSGTTWSRQATLTGPHGARNDFFGFSVALSPARALVGATYGVFSTPPPSHCGTAYEFTRSGHTWGERTELVNPGCSNGDLFGWSLAISGTTAMIGAPAAHDYAGAVYQEDLR